MLNLPTPPQSTFTEPMLWWLFWFATAIVVYALLAVWFTRVAKRETRPVPAGAVPPEAVPGVTSSTATPTAAAPLPKDTSGAGK